MPVDVQWRPIAFGVLIRAIGKVPWSLSDEATVEAGRRECERRAAEAGLPPLRWAEGWPAGNYSLLPLRAAVIAEAHGRLKPFSLAVFRQNFEHGRDLRDVDVVTEAGREAGVPDDEIRRGVGDPEIKDTLRARTDAAIAEGITGIPTVVLADGRRFWGDDRLEDAAAAAL
jgi:2-hydroxychromene-2-carboxylate isomerase